MLPRGYLIGAFVTKAIYYVPDIDVRPLPDPIPILKGDTPSIIDIAQTRKGDILFTTGLNLYRLDVPLRGDCNGDYRVDYSDVAALRRQLEKGTEATLASSYWGCDVNGDGLINSDDLAALMQILGIRIRAVRSR